MPFFVFFMPKYVPLSKIRLSWHSQLTYLTSFRSVVLNTHKLLSAPASVCLCRAIKIPIFLLLQAFLFTINFAAVLFINENTCQSESKRLQINAYFN